MKRNQKLCVRYYGPYKVLKRIGNAPYQIDFPKDSRVHNIFLVSQLKKRIGKGKTIYTELHGIKEDGELAIEPVVVLERKLVKEAVAAPQWC